MPNVRDWSRLTAATPWFHRCGGRYGTALLALLLALGAVLPVQAAGEPFLVRDINTQPSTMSSYLSELMNVNGTLFFSTDDGINGRELWKSDGTAAGTVIVEDIRPGTDSSSPHLLTNVNGTLYFAAFAYRGGPQAL